MSTPMKKPTLFSGSKKNNNPISLVDQNTQSIIKELDMEIEKIKSQNIQQFDIDINDNFDEVIEANDKFPHAQNSLDDEFNNDQLLIEPLAEDADKK